MVKPVKPEGVLAKPAPVKPVEELAQRLPNGHKRAHQLDRTDIEILRLLQDNARMTFSEIGRRVHLSQPAVAERVRLLEDAGVISGYHAHVDSTKLGYPIFAIMHVEGRTPFETEQVSALARRTPEILECHSITGRDGLVLKVITPSISRLNEIIKAVAEFSPPTTSIVLNTPLARKGVEPL
jgi:Lrp/AsnC family transcriptional regulator, leucine-responsive regulatory protein